MNQCFRSGISVSILKWTVIANYCSLYYVKYVKSLSASMTRLHSVMLTSSTGIQPCPSLFNITSGVFEDRYAFSVYKG